jgi:transcriptional regulator with XRE-family HTH domain
MTEQEFYKDIGAKLRALRKKAGLTQEQVAQKAEIGQPDLATFEKKGERIKSADIIRRIVEATGHAMGDLFAEPAQKKTLTPSQA